LAAAGDLDAEFAGNPDPAHPQTMKTLPASLAAMFLLYASPAAAQEPEDPGRIVQNTVNQVLAVLADADLPETERRAKVYALAATRIDFGGISRRILATHWIDATAKQRQRFEELFREILLGSYWARLRHYRNERVEYITLMMEGDALATVDTVIVTDRVEIPISYRMERVNGKWMAYDFLVESLSLVTNFRNEYRNLIKLNGIDGLLEQMEREAERKQGEEIGGRINPALQNMTAVGRDLSRHACP
jgi:phospholipid transport system substrate-binding protein